MVEVKADGSGTGGVSVKLSAKQTKSLEAGETHIIRVAAKNDTSSAAILKIYLKNEDNSAATDLTTPNLLTEEEITDTETQKTLEDTLGQAVTCADGSKAALEAEWKEEKDSDGNVTYRYLQAVLPAGAEAGFDMELTYDLPDGTTGSYEKKVNVEGIASVDDADVTETEADESADNRETVSWSGDTEVTEIDETMDGMVMLASEGSRTWSAGDYLYLDISSLPGWADDSAQFVLYYLDSSDAGYHKVLSSYATYLYRIQIPENMDTSKVLLFLRCDPGKYSSDGSGWPGNDTVWNKTNDLYLQANSNTYRITGWGSNNNVSTGNWNGWNTSNYANETLYFLNMDTDTTDFVPDAEFSVSSDKASGTNHESMSKVDGSERLYQVTIPGEADYDTVTFKNGSTVLATERIMNGSGSTYAPTTTNTYYYKATEGNQEKSYWDICPNGTSSLAGKTLYLGSSFFDGSKCKLKISGKEYDFTQQDGKSRVTIPEASAATQKSILTVVDGTTEYNFIWNSIGDNQIILSDGIAKVSGRIGGYTLYFDATLSKLNYYNSREGNQEGFGIPSANSDNEYDGGITYENLYYSIRKADGTYSYGNVSAVDGSSYNLYQIGNLDASCEKIKFSNYELSDSNKDNTPGIGGYTTDWLEIPWNQYASPCFYADTSDSTIYDGGYRGGYWDEIGAVRNAEKGKNSDVVDIPSGTFTREENVLYVNTTLYDYYTDYELNGNNRDSYNNVSVTSHRIYQPFRQFDQALSDYYKSKDLNNSSNSLLYWGNFQNFTGSPFKDIAGTLGLLGFEFGDNISLNGKSDDGYFSSTSDNYKKFFYENNSMFARNGSKLSNGNSATQGLVNWSLQNGNLILANGAEAPFFDENFLNGENSKNTVLGEVYKDVTFPFVKTKINSTSSNGKIGQVDYWCFDSANQNLANKNLQLTYDSNSGYFMQSTNSEVKGRTTAGATAKGNYFPFNTSAQSGNAATLNYGFGQKFEIDFRLTEDGTVVADKANESDPDVKLPIEFKFSGDDDVWVFIDDKLVLDVGGGHGVVEGTINFQNKTAKVSSVKDTSGSDVTNNKQYGFSSEFDSDFYKKQHTLTMFYMERGLWESNMKITFNMPDSNKLTVEKEVDTADVDSLFAECFADKTLLQFPMHIQNYATSGSDKEVTSSGQQINPITFNGSAIPTSTANTFVKSNEMKSDKQADYYWFAKEYNTNQAYTDKRLGEITADSSVDASQASYLQFEMYFEGGKTPTLNQTYVQLEDESGKKVGGYLEGKIVGKPNMQTGTWIKMKVNLSMLTSVGGDTSFDWTKVKKAAFQYDESRGIYLREFQFVGSGNASTTLTGFTTKQEEIPTYGSVTKKCLMDAAGAIYRLSGNGQADQSLNVDQDGVFILKDGQSAVFSDQFRRGSYIYLEEYVNSSVFDTTWI